MFAAIPWLIGGGLAVLGLSQVDDASDSLTRLVVVSTVAGVATALIVPTVVKAIK